jgi:hypothetical protein
MRHSLSAGLVGGLVVFAWSAVDHMLLPFGEMGLTQIPAEKEPAVLAQLKELPGNGLYMYPRLEGKDAAAHEAWMRKVASGPSGLLLYHPAGAPVMNTGTFVGEIGADILAALIAAFVLSQLSLFGLLARAGLVSLLGVFAWLSISLSYLIWYGYPPAFVLAEGVDQVVGWFLGGLAMAALLRRR